MAFMKLALAGALCTSIASAVKVGDDLSPYNILDYGFPPEKINLFDRVMNKKVGMKLNLERSLHSFHRTCQSSGGAPGNSDPNPGSGP